MFEKSESDNTLLFTMVRVIFLLIDASLGGGVPKRVAECWALRPMGECNNAFFDGPRFVQQQT